MGGDSVRQINNLFNVVLNSLVALEFLILNNKYIRLKKEQEIFGSLKEELRNMKDRFKRKLVTSWK